MLNQEEILNLYKLAGLEYHTGRDNKLIEDVLRIREFFSVVDKFDITLESGNMEVNRRRPEIVIEQEYKFKPDTLSRDEIIRNAGLESGSLFIAKSKRNIRNEDE